MSDDNNLCERLGALATDLQRRGDPSSAKVCLAAAGQLHSQENELHVWRQRHRGLCFAGELIACAALVALVLAFWVVTP